MLKLHIIHFPHRSTVFKQLFWAVDTSTSMTINAQTAAVLDLSTVGQALVDAGVEGTRGAYTVISDQATLASFGTLVALDAAVSVVVSGEMSALDNENFAASASAAFGTLFSDSGTNI